jgi:hypothetical protein
MASCIPVLRVLLKDVREKTRQRYGGGGSSGQRTFETYPKKGASSDGSHDKYASTAYTTTYGQSQVAEEPDVEIALPTMRPESQEKLRPVGHEPASMELGASNRSDGVHWC